jgi:lysophospholipase L1-like esterase
MSGILKITDHPDKWHIAGRLGDRNQNLDLWEANSVWEQAERYINADVWLLFDCGEEDTKTGAIDDARKLRERLVSLKIPHIWREMPGTHSWKYWQEHLEEHLNFHQAAMVEVTPQLGKWRALYFTRLSKFFQENAQLAVETASSKTMCLLGSSSMQGFSSDLVPDCKVFNRGISADTLGIGSRGISHRLESSVFDMRPDYIFIKNGRNDLGNRHRTGEPSIERMIEEYEEIVSAIKERLPESQLQIITCAPVRDRYAHLATPTNSFNMQLKVLGDKYDIPVLDLYEKLVGDDGLLLPDYSKDGLHLSESGYVLWAEMMLDVISKETAHSTDP